MPALLAEAGKYAAPRSNGAWPEHVASIVPGGWFRGAAQQAPKARSSLMVDFIFKDGRAKSADFLRVGIQVDHRGH